MKAVAALGEPLPSPAATGGKGTEGEGSGGGAGDETSGSLGVSEAREGGSDGEVALLLACLCRGLGTTFVNRVPEILGRWGLCGSCAGVLAPRSLSGVVDWWSLADGAERGER